MGYNFLLIPLDIIDQQVEEPIPGTKPERLSKAEALYHFRRRRVNDVPEDLLGEPAWDILLLTYIADLRQEDWPVTSICAGSGVPDTTALRYIATLERRGFIGRIADNTDKRRYFVRITDEGRTMMDRAMDRAL